MNKKQEPYKTSLELAFAKARHKRRELHKQLDEALAKGQEVYIKVAPPKGRVCVSCGVLHFALQNVYCSEECHKVELLEEKKNPFTKTSTGKTTRLLASVDSTWYVGAYDEVCLPQDVSAYLCSLPDEPYVSEDEEYLNDCIWQDLPQAKNADGSIYVSPKTQYPFSEHQAFITREQSSRAYRHRMARKHY